MRIEILFKERTGLEFNTFYKKYRPKLLWYLMKMSNDMTEAEEITDEAIIKAVDEIEKYEKDKSQFSTWLFTIAKRLMIQRLKFKNRLQSLETEQQEGVCLGDFLIADNRDMVIVDNTLTQQADIIKRRIPELPEKYATVLQMRELDGLTYQEIAETLNLNLNTVKSQIKQGRELLKKRVKQDFDALELSTFWDVAE